MESAEAGVAAARGALDAGQFEDAMRWFDETVALYGGAEDRNARAWAACALAEKAEALHASGRLEESVVVRDQLISQFGDDDADYLRLLLSRAFDGKGRALFRLGRYDEQLRSREKELSWYAVDEPADPPFARARALVGRAVALTVLGREVEAASAWGEVLACVDGVEDLAARRIEAQALRNRSANYRRSGDFRAALDDADTLMERFDQTEDRYIMRMIAQGLLEQAWAWREMGMPQLAEAPLERLATQFAGQADKPTEDAVTRGLLLRAEAYRERGELETADELYDVGLRRARSSNEVLVWEDALTAIAGKASVLARGDALDEALALLDQGMTEATKRFGDNPNHAARLLWAKLGVLVSAGRNEDVIRLADEIEGSFAGSEDPVVRETVARALIERVFACGNLGRAGASARAAEALHEHPEDALMVLDQQISSLEAARGPREQRRLAPRLLLRAGLLTTLDRPEESADAYQALIDRFGSTDDPAILATVEFARQLRSDIEIDDR